MSDTISRNGNAIVTLAAIVIVVYGMQFAKALLVPFLVALFLALISVRPMLWMQKKRVPAILAALIIVSFLALVLTFVGTIVGRSIADFTAAIPTYQLRLNAILDSALQISADRPWMDDAIVSVKDMINPGFIMGLLARFLNGLRDVVTNLFLIVITMIFMLLEASTVRTKVEAAFGHTEATFDKQRLFLQDLGRYLGIKTLVSFATGFLAWLLTWSIGLDFPLLWGMLAFLLNYVPTVGSIIAAVPPVILALVLLGPGEALAILAGFAGINILFGNFLEPRLMGYGVGISPLVVIVGLFFWGWVLGPVGMLLSVPLTMTLKLALENDENTRWIAIFLGSGRDAQHELSARTFD
ncbi:MAG TPA: AI-2E family transporter [Woeseiaceae bacterium]|nr:AI-2E family transporter [Woeseiaceae bacterium]